MTLTVGSLFAGIGGFDHGFALAGLHTSVQVEIDPTCRAVLARHFPDARRHDDVTTADAATLGPVDLLCGGFPCQDVSVAGRRAGLAGARSGLFHEFARLIDAVRPTWVVIENVPGLLSSHDGRDMGTVLGALGDRGYGWAYRVLDAQYFGVAQRRRRVIIVGHLGDATRAAEVLFEREGGGGDPPPRRRAGQDAARGIAVGVALRGRDGGATAELGDDAAFALRASQGGGDKSHALVPAIAGTLGSKVGGSRTTDLDGIGAYIPSVAHTLRAEGFDASEDGTGRGTPLVPVAYGVSEDQRAEVRLTDYARQITTGGGKPGQGYPAVMQGMAVRRLTPAECERLQGFPDGWTAARADGTPISDSARYRQLGNAVAVPVAEWIGRRIVRVHQGQRGV